MAKRIRIKQCSSERFWYDNRIGEEFDVIKERDEDDMTYCVHVGRVLESWVSRADAEEIKEVRGLSEAQEDSGLDCTRKEENKEEWTGRP
jgi:hypothetical protein